MKNTFSILIIIGILLNVYSFSFKDDFTMKNGPIDKLWEKFEEKYRDNHLQEAINLLEDIKDLAEEQHLQDHIIKAEISRLILVERTTKGTDYQTYIGGLQNLVTKEKDSILKALYQVYLAKAYANYSHRYFNQQKPNTVDEDDDYTQWSEKKRSENIISLFQEALNTDEISGVKIKDFDALVEDQEKTDFTSLEDVLMSEFVRVFQDTRNNLSDFEIKGILSQEAILGSSNEFANIDVPQTKDPSLATVFSIFQNYYVDKLSTGTDDEKFALELQRLDLMSSLYTGTQSDSLTLNAAKRIFETSNKSVKSKAYEFYVSKLIQEYNWSSMSGPEIFNKHSKIYQENKSLNTKIVKSYQDVEKSLLIDIQVEDYIPKNQDFIINLSHHNIDHIEINIYSISQDEIEEFNTLRYDKREKFIRKLRLIHQSEVSIPVFKGLKNQNLELSLKGLDAGLYIILGTVSNHFDRKKSHKYSLVNVTDFRITSNNNRSIKIFDAYSGQKLNLVDYTLYKYDYSRAHRKRIKKIVKDGTTQDGEIKYTTPKHEYANYSLELRKGNDHAWFHNIQSYSHRNKEDIKTVYRVFTDRSIYRPGQTLYYKVWSYQFQNDKIEAKNNVNTNIKIELLDANGQLQSETILKSNEYGTVHGHFVIPDDLMPGQYNLRIDNQYHNFRVEEYKRPTFKVDIKKPDGLIKLGDIIPIKGDAIAVAGYPIAYANVEIKVTKEKYYFPGCFYFYYPQNSSPTIIYQNTLQTDEKGEFKFSLPTELEHNNLYFNYKIVVDITSQSGETHSSLLNLYIGEKPRRINLTLDDHVIKNDERLSYKAALFNAVNEKLQDELQIEIHRLKVPQNLNKKRYWEFPDTILASKDESVYNSDSKHVGYSYTDDYMISDWGSDGVIISHTINSNEQFSERYLDAGSYRIIALHSDGSQSIQHFHVVDDSIYNVNEQKIEIKLSQGEYSVGDEAEIEFFAPRDWNLNVYISHRDNSIDYHFIDDPKDRKLIIPVSRSDMGDIIINASAIYGDRFYESDSRIPVSFEPYELKLEAIKIDSILKPGEKTTWKFKLTDSEDNPVTGRIVATLYDESLDLLNDFYWEDGIFNKTYSFLRNHPIGMGNVFFNYLKYDHNQQFQGFIYPQLPSLWSMDNVYHRRYLNPVRAKLSGAVELNEVSASDEAVIENGELNANDATLPQSENKVEESNDKIEVRENLNELVFFYPELEADENGIFTIDFKMNDDISNWKLMLFGQTLDLKTKSDEFYVKTQKEIMIIPQMPRFLREKDKVNLKALIVSPTNLTGDVFVEIDLINSLTNNNVNDKFDIANTKQKITLDKSGQVAAEFAIDVPSLIEVPFITYIIKAKIGDKADAVKDDIPILSNRILVNESKSFFVPAHTDKEITFKDFLLHNNSESLESQFIELQYTPNPAWMTVKALAYYDQKNPTTTSLVSSIYAKTIGKHLTSQYPEIQEVFKQWKSTDELESELNRNKDLLNEILQQSPWLMNAVSEEEQRKSIALFFDLNNLNRGLENDLKKLRRIQKPDGGFPWIDGSRYSSAFVTIAVLQHLFDMADVTQTDITSNSIVSEIVRESMEFLDENFEDYYENLERNKSLSKDIHIPNSIIRYFIFNQKLKRDIDSKLAKRINEVQKIADRNWNSYSYFERIFLARNSYLNSFDSYGEIIESLVQPLVKDEELGAYYKGEFSGDFYSRSILQNAYLIELLNEVNRHQDFIPYLQLYILQNKRTQDWGESSLTAKVVNSFLNVGNKNWLQNSGDHSIKWHNKNLSSKIENKTLEYSFRENGSTLDNELANVNIHNQSNHMSWGSLHWQYFEDFDKVQKSEEEQALSIERKFFKRVRKGNKEEYKPINQSDIKVGDRIKVRLTLRSDRKIDYVHVQDFRPSGTEPTDVLSRFYWENGLYYYKVTRDVSTDFYINRLNEGTFVLDYDLNVSHEGDFSAGLSRIQSYYAPEMAGQSEGIRILIK